MRRAYREVLMSAGAVVILVLTLAAFDVRVRDQLSRHLTANPRMEFASVGYQIRDFTNVIAQAARAQSFGHETLLLFALVSAVLFLFMLRT